MNRIKLFCIFMFCLVFINLITSGQDDLQISPPLLEDPREDFVTEFTDDGIKYYNKIFPGDTTVDKNMPQYNPEREYLTEEKYLDIVEKPIPLDKVQPDVSNIKIKKPATVWVKCLVDKDGTVKNASVIRSDAQQIINDACTETAIKWKYSPAEVRGKPVATWVVIPFKFTPSKE